LPGSIRGRLRLFVPPPHSAKPSPPWKPPRHRALSRHRLAAPSREYHSLGRCALETSPNLVSSLDLSSRPRHTSASVCVYPSSKRAGVVLLPRCCYSLFSSIYSEPSFTNGLLKRPGHFLNSYADPRSFVRHHLCRFSPALFDRNTHLPGHLARPNPLTSPHTTANQYHVSNAAWPPRQSRRNPLAADLGPWVPIDSRKVKENRKAREEELNGEWENKGRTN